MRGSNGEMDWEKERERWKRGRGGLGKIGIVGIRNE